MPLQRVRVDQLVGVNRNAAEGAAGLAPAEVRNLAFDRQGGLVALGARKADFSDDVTSASVLAYDESTMALMSSPAVWSTSRLIDLVSAAFVPGDLVLIPRGGVLAPFVRTAAGAITGAAFVRDRSGTFAEYTAAPTATVTAGGAGSEVPSATYELLWMLEAPTDAGMMVYAVGSRTHTQGSGVVDLDVELDSVIPAGHVVRFYYRRDDAGYERFATKVSDGIDEVVATLTAVSAPEDFTESQDAIVNFAPARAETHEGRVWGVARERPFLPLLPSSAQERTEAYFAGTIAPGTTGQALSSPLASGDIPWRLANDAMTFHMDEGQVARSSPSLSASVPLVKLEKDATNYAELCLYWAPSSLALPNPAVQAQLSVRLVVGGFAYRVSSVLSGAVAPSLARNTTPADLEPRQYRAQIQSISSASGTTSVLVRFLAYDKNGVLLHQEDRTLATTDAHWTSWSTAAAGTVRLLSNTVELANATIQFSAARGYRGATLLYGANIDDYTSGTSFTGEDTETWTLASAANAVVVYKPIEVGEAITIAQPNLTLVYTNVGSANRGNQANFVTLTPTASSRITALASTPAGLLAFMENETWLLSGNPDPVSGDLRVQRFSGTMGCDPGVIPGRLGAVVFPIYRGELYAINLGMGDVDFGSGVENIGRAVWRRDDPFVQVVGENQRNHLVARTASNRVYRYDAEVKQWVNDVFDGVLSGVGDSFVLTEDGDNVLTGEGGNVLLEESSLEARLVLIPACLCPSFGTRYLVNSTFQVVDFAAVPDEVWVEWRDIDLGDRQQAKLWRRMEVATDDAYVGPPTMRYRTRGAVETVTGVQSGRGRWSFSFKRGEVGAKADVRIDLPGFGPANVLEAPVELELAPRNRSRGRVA